MIPESSVLLDCHLHGHVDLGGFSCEYEKLFSTPQNSTEPELFTLVQWFSSSSAIPATPILLSRTGIDKDGSCEQRGGNDSQGGERWEKGDTDDHTTPTRAHNNRMSAVNVAWLDLGSKAGNPSVSQTTPTPGTTS